MIKNILADIRKRLVYNPVQSPLDNINIFFQAVERLIFEVIKLNNKEETFSYLEGAWRDETDLATITSEFEQQLYKHLVACSTGPESEIPYPEMLRRCRDLLRMINRHYESDNPGVIMTSEPIIPTDAEKQEDFKSMPEGIKNTVYKCYHLLRLFFLDLEELVKEELEEVRNLQLRRDKSKYEWIVDKIDFSELALSIFASGAVKPRGNRKMMEYTFARELAAFFGIDQINYDQDIASLSFKKRRKPGQFLDHCRASFDKHLNDKLSPKRKKKSA